MRNILKKVFQLQELAVKHFRITVCLFAVATIFFLYGNYLTPSKSVIPKDAVMDRENPVRKMDDYTGSKKEYGFRPDEPIVITKKFPEGIKSIEDLKAILDLHDFIKTEFSKRGLDGDRLASLATVPRFLDDGEKLTGEYYINPSIFKTSQFNIEEWKRWVEEDPAVYGKYVSRDFKTAILYFYVEDGIDEMMLVWKVKSALEQKEFGWVSQFLETDIYPKDESIGLAGWIVGRWIIRQEAVIEILTITTTASLFVLWGFYRALGSWTQAVVSLIMFFMAIIWTRGSVGFLSVAGSKVGESPYLLFSYAICILQGVSFSLQKFIAYNRAVQRGYLAQEVWKQTKGIDRLIGILAGISISSFACLWWAFGVRPIVDMAIASGIGILYLWIFSRYLLPAIFSWLETKEVAFRKLFSSRIFLPLRLFGWLMMTAEKYFGLVFVEIPLKVISRINFFSLSQKNIKGFSVAVILLIFGLTGWAAYEIIWPNHNLLVRSKPLEFIPGTIAYRTSQELNQEDQLGFDGLNFLIEPNWRNNDGIYDPVFVKMISEVKDGLITRAEEIGAREVATIIESVEKISRESFRKKIPENEKESGYAFMNIQNKLKPVILDTTLYNNGVRLTVTCAADDSNNMADLRDAVVDYVHENFPDLKINAFGRANAYPEVDREIREGKPWNIAGDQGIIYFVFLVLILTAKNYARNANFLSPWWGALIMNTPMWFATMALALVMVYFEIPLDLATAVISAFSINATSDFSLHLLRGFVEELKEKNARDAMAEVLSHHGRTIVEDAFLNSRIFLPLYLFSNFIPIQRIGTTMLLMLSLCLVAMLILTPPLLVLAVKERRQNRISLRINTTPVFEQIG